MTFLALGIVLSVSSKDSIENLNTDNPLNILSETE
jgi:hypothetical protein